MSWQEAMALYPRGGSRGDAFGETNGTTEVEMVAAPDANQRRLVAWVAVVNRDNAERTLTILHRDTARGTPRRAVGGMVLAAGEGDEWPKHGFVELDSTTETLEIVSDASAAADEPEWMVAWLDAEE